MTRPTTLRVTLLGSGTSTGVPVIGCRCAVCTSEDPRNQRMRPALYLELGRELGRERGLLVDTPPDLRQQALRFGVERVDAVLYTHAHADHVYGLDDVRIFNFRQRRPIPCYGSAETLAAIRGFFAYVFDGQPAEGGGKPQLELREVDGPLTLGGLRIVPVPIRHGSLEVLGYRFGPLAYLTDCNHIPEASFPLLEGLEVLILGALRFRPHATHFTVAEAVEAAERIGARRTVLTHMSHEVDYRAPEARLPAGMEFGYDGLVFELEIDV
jgi:phosphoribosyl 1,2-cyclic phosphate phosphodiesterase